MVLIGRLSGIAGALWGAWFPITLLFVMLPSLPMCPGRCGVRDGSVEVYGREGVALSYRFTLRAWTPFLDDPRGPGMANDAPDCPGPRLSQIPPTLVEAPLPLTYDPQQQSWEGPLFGCVRIGNDGSVQSAMLLREMRDPEAEWLLLRTIRREWRFRPDILQHEEREWHRVRLSAEPDIRLHW